MQDGTTSLYISSQMGHRVFVKALLKNSANIEAADEVLAHKMRVRGSGLGFSKCVFVSTHTNTQINGHKGSISFVCLHTTHTSHIHDTLHCPLCVYFSPTLSFYFHTQISHPLTYGDDAEWLHSLYISSQCGHRGVVKALLKNSANIEAAHNVRVGGSVFWASQSVIVCLHIPTHKSSMCASYAYHTPHTSHTYDMFHYPLRLYFHSHTPSIVTHKPPIS